jgi:very-short-patch-repair endonuclease
MPKQECGDSCATGGSPASSFADRCVQNYILDFVCFEQRVVVEIDGSQHYESRRDETRDAVLASEGFRVIRYWNNDVLQRSASVLEDLFSKLSGETH